MKHKRFYFLGFSALTLLLLSLLLPASVAKAENASQLVNPQQYWIFPCSDILSPTGGPPRPSENVISKDWLSGNKGRLANTYAADTYTFPQVRTLFGYMEGLAFLLITPSILLLGYQIMLGASTFRYVGALEGLSRVLLGGGTVVASFALVQILIHFENILTAGIVLLHSEQPYPIVGVSRIPVLFMFRGEPAASYRGIVVPMSRWGCAAHDFVGIFSPVLVTNLASNIPLMSNFVPLAGTVTTMADLVHRLGQMGLAVLSMLLWVQVFIRILLLNYYILVTPLAFACWALPGGVGANVVRLWGRGFLSVLFVQAIQLFVLTTLPLLLPVLPQSFAGINTNAESAGILQGLLVQFPPILTLCVVLIVPTYVGASISKALGAASSVAREVVVAVGTGVQTGKRSVGRKKEKGSEENGEGQLIPGTKWALTRKSKARNGLSKAKPSSSVYTMGDSLL